MIDLDQVKRGPHGSRPLRSRVTSLCSMPVREQPRLGRLIGQILRNLEARGTAMRTDAVQRTETSRCGVWVALVSISFLAAPASAQTDLEKYQTAERLATEHIAKYRTADFDVFTNQRWDRIKESHAKDVVVHWPDGRQTNGVEAHIEDLKAMFVYAPDTRIREHPVEIATGEWSSVIGIMEGTFTKPMPTPDGKTIPPTGKPFKVMFSAVDHWKDGLIDDEYLFWDNLTFMRQVGLAQ